MHSRGAVGEPAGDVERLRRIEPVRQASDDTGEIGERAHGNAIVLERIVHHIHHTNHRITERAGLLSGGGRLTAALGERISEERFATYEEFAGAVRYGTCAGLGLHQGQPRTEQEVVGITAGVEVH